MAKRTRRKFLADAAKVAGGLSVLGATGCFPEVGGSWAQARADCSPASPLPIVPGPSLVVEAYSDAAVSTDPDTFRNTINAAEVEAMLERVLGALSGNAANPWAVLLPDCTSASRVGIKVNTLNAMCPTSVPLVKALVASLKAGLGLPAEQIVVWDRADGELLNAGFTSDSVGASVIGTLSTSGDPASPGYEGSYCAIDGKTTRLSRILTELTDVTINCPVLKTHEVSGVTGALKNVYGIIDNPGDFHDDLNSALPAIYAIGPIRSRIRLTIVDALVAITSRGTASPVDTVPKRLFGSQDALAADSYAVALVNQIRAAGNRPSVDPSMTNWLGNSEGLGLGTLAYVLRSV